MRRISSFYEVLMQASGAQVSLKKYSHPSLYGEGWESNVDLPPEAFREDSFKRALVVKG